MSGQKDKRNWVQNLMSNSSFHRVIIGLFSFLVIFFVTEPGAAPKKYNIAVGQKSAYDIIATRDIIDTVKTEKMKEDAVAAIRPILVRREEIAFAAKEKVSEFFNIINISRNTIQKNLLSREMTPKSEGYVEALSKEIDDACTQVVQKLGSLSFVLSTDQAKYLLKLEDKDLERFHELNVNVVSQAMKSDITAGTLEKAVKEVKESYEKENIPQELKEISIVIGSSVLKPNLEEDVALTQKEKEAARNNPDLVQKVEKGTRIIMNGEIVTDAQYKMLEQLNLLKTGGRIDYGFTAGILIILLLFMILLIIYMNYFCKDILNSRNDLILLSLVVILTLLVARGVAEFSIYAIPISVAAMLIAILLDVKLAVIINAMLAVIISFIAKGDVDFIYLSLAGGTMSAFAVMKADQRSKLTLAGLIVSVTNTFVIISLGMMNKADGWTLLRDGFIGFLNGMVSVIITIGSLPFWESTFNVITPLKLLELSNPNQPLIKRLLMEAPGTYHHSLMVGNLAEVATDAIGGNSLLARVGAYYHDVGKLRRPYFFKENQFTDNPHDRMTPNLSTLVITSHTRDGEELANKYKLPMAIRELIRQHHGTTLVAYFYYKAKKCDKTDTVKMENFRYEGPKPTSKEGAVIMLADSVEAAVRAMVDKTEGKIEGLIRKIIKDKLDDGQLDMCDLTLKDLDLIAKGFIRVFSGFLHEREEYPEIKIKEEGNVEATEAKREESNPEENREVYAAEGERNKNAEVDYIDGDYH